MAESVNNLRINLVCSIHNVINLSRFSSLMKLTIFTGYVRHFVSKFKGALKNGKTILISDNTLTTNE